MTWIEVEGFEVYGDLSTSSADLLTALDKRYDAALNSGATFSLVDNDNADGTFALQCDATTVGQSQYFRLPIPSAYNLTASNVPELVYAFRYYYTDGGSGFETFLNVKQGNFGAAAGSTSAALKCDENGTVRWSDTTGDADSSSGVFVDGTWYYVEVRFLCGGSSDGELQVYIDGSSVINVTGRTTMLSFFKFWGMELRNDQGRGIAGFDDLCVYELDGVDHSTVLGDIRVIPLIVDADASPNDWTPQTGTDNYAMIDEDELDETDYVTSASDGDDEHYTFPTASAASVECVQIDAECIATSGTPTLHVGIHDGTDTIEGDEGVIGTGSNEVVRVLFDTQADGTDWDLTGLNATELTQRVTE